MTGADLEDRALVTARLWLEAAQAGGHWVSPDGRVGLATAAWLLGVAHGHLRNLIAEGRGPAVYATGGAGHKRSVRLLALAEWLESRRTE